MDLGSQGKGLGLHTMVAERRKKAESQEVRVAVAGDLWVARWRSWISATEGGCGKVPHARNRRRGALLRPESCNSRVMVLAVKAGCGQPT